MKLAGALSPYLQVADENLRLLSVFDDLSYDRADADMLSPAMRRHAIGVLADHGFRQTSGTVLTHTESGNKCVIPKFHALGASPFDILRYTKRGPSDYVLLTPTQTACQYIEIFDHEAAVERVKALIVSQPINIYRLMDYLDKTPDHRAFQNAIGHLKYVQRTAIESDPLRSRRALG